MALIDKTATDEGTGTEARTLNTSPANNSGSDKGASDSAMGSESATVIKNGVWPYVYPFTAVPLAPSHTWGRVLSIDEIHGTQGQ